MSNWTLEKISILKTRWSLGHPVEEIAKELEVTRNAVIGKAHRLDLPIHPKGRKVTKKYLTNPVDTNKGVNDGLHE